MGNREIKANDVCKKCGFKYGEHSGVSCYCPSLTGVNADGSTERFDRNSSFELDPKQLLASEMTIRDVFAAHALNGMLPNDASDYINHPANLHPSNLYWKDNDLMKRSSESYAKAAYYLADAMLKERETK